VHLYLHTGQDIVIVDPRKAGVARVKRERQTVSVFETGEIAGDIGKQQAIGLNQHRLAVSTGRGDNGCA
jgi:hypothetical protein